MVLLSYFFISYMLSISLTKYASEREYVSTCLLSFCDNLCFGSVSFSFARITKAPNPLLFNNYLVDTRLPLREAP